MTPVADVYHRTVMVQEIVQSLRVQPGGRYIDCTVGEAGHALAILEASTPGGLLLGLDADPYALEAARRRLQRFDGAFRLEHANFVRLAEVAHAHGFVPVHGILFDLGLSSLQLEGEERGFSFRRPDPLDMRFSPDQEITADDIVNTYSQAELTHVLHAYGEERRARRIAEAIVRQRPLHTASELADVVAHAVGQPSGHRPRINPATRTFMALRIAVNRELENLEQALRQAIGLLGHGGRLAVISYHSLEDRIVKTVFREESRDCICPPGLPECQCGHRATLRLVTRKALTPTAVEVQGNPRARSAKLRATEHL